MRPAFPYPTLFGDVDLEVTAVSVDGLDLPYARISRPERTVALGGAGRADWETAVLRLQATVPEEELLEPKWSDPSCVAILTEAQTNTRTTAILRRASTGVWAGSLDLVAANHVSRARLSLAVVGTVDGIGGRVIGSTERDWYIDLRSQRPIRQHDIQIVEEDFADGPQEWLRPFRDAPWLVDTGGDVPTVYLNTGAVEGLRTILSGTGGSPAEKMLRELTISQIAQSAWSGMFQTATEGLETDEDGTPMMPGGWRGRVLQMMLPDVFPKLQAADALYEIRERRRKDYGWAELQAGIQYAAVRRSQVKRMLTAAVRSTARDDESGGSR
jgi:hypothetical protein